MALPHADREDIPYRKWGMLYTQTLYSGADGEPNAAGSAKLSEIKR